MSKVFRIFRSFKKSMQKRKSEENFRHRIKISFSDIYSANNPTGIYLFKINNGIARRICETCSKLTVKTLERCHLLTDFTHCSGVSIVDYEHVNTRWGRYLHPLSKVSYFRLSNFQFKSVSHNSTRMHPVWLLSTK